MTITAGYNLKKLEVVLNGIFPNRVFNISLDRYGINVGYYFKNGRKFDLEDDEYEEFYETLMDVLSNYLDSVSVLNLSTHFMGYSNKLCAV